MHGVRRGWLRFEAKRNERTAKASLILISISWCDVYLTTRRRDATSEHISLPPFLFLSLSLSSSLLSSSLPGLKFLARCFIQRHRRLLSAKVETNAWPPSAPSPLERGAQVAATAICIQSTLIRLKLAEGGRKGTHLPSRLDESQRHRLLESSVNSMTFSSRFRRSSVLQWLS